MLTIQGYIQVYPVPAVRILHFQDADSGDVKSRGSFPVYLASEVQKRSNTQVLGQNLATKVSKSRIILPYVPGVNPRDGH